jgi:hypothetical protein
MSRSGGRDLRWLSVGVAVVGLVSLAVCAWAALVLDQFSRGLVIGLCVALTPAIVVGLLISMRKPSMIIGPLVVALGTHPAFTFSLEALYPPDEPAPNLPGPVALALLTSSSWVWWYVWAALIALLFPDGRLPSPSWRFVALGLLCGAAIVATGTTLDPQTYVDSGSVSGPPLSVPTALIAAITIPALFGLAALLVAAVASLFGRYRRGGTVTRLQIRWLAAGAAAFPLTLVTGWVVMWLLDKPWSVFLLIGLGIGAVTMPTSIAVAVLRYGLWDLDKLVSRTTSYLVVTVTVVAVYAVVVTSMSRLLPTSSTFSVAVGTLVAAAVMRPVFRRVQHVVDRRFNRAQFDAQQSVEAFGTRLRGRTHADDVVVDLVGVLRSTLQPATVVLWRPGDPPE